MAKVVAFSIWICAGHAGAQAATTDDATRAAARELGVEGIAAYQANDFTSADQKLERAYRLYPAPTLGLYSARARAKLGRLVEAAERYRQATRNAAPDGSELGAQREAQEEAAQELEALVPRIPTLTIVLEGANVAQVSTTLDGAPYANDLIGVARPTNPGPHRLLATQGSERVGQTLTLVEKERKIVTVTLHLPTDLQPTPAPGSQAESASSATNAKSIWFSSHAGMGVGSRWIRVPTQPGRVGVNRISSAFTPALDIGVGFGVALTSAWQLRANANYRTVLALAATYQPPRGMETQSTLSSHSIIAGASLGHVSNGLDSFGVHVFLGWAYRGLSASEPNLPSARIQGVVLRPELEIPMANRKLTLRLAPELIVVVAQSATLPSNDSGVSGGVGYALGGEVELALRISQSVAISAQFRESRGSSPSRWGSSGIESERYIVLRFQLRF